MSAEVLLSSPAGDIRLRGPDLERPFRMTPSADHPFLSLGDYFRGIESFVRERGLSGRAGGELEDGPPEPLLIRSEKHGALYHVCRVEVRAGSRRSEFGVLTALSRPARETLHREFDLLAELSRRTDPPLLPRPFFRKEVTLGREGRQASGLMCLVEWLPGFHEWHLAPGPARDRPGIVIWDLQNGLRPASESECRSIFRQAARILTLLCDPGKQRHIHPWHHAAGDFVVRPAGDGVQLKLTTARGYPPIIPFSEAGAVPLLFALVYFVLQLTVQMRLDRADGVGEPLWAGTPALEAALEGFLEGLAGLSARGRLSRAAAGDALGLLRSLSPEELLQLYAPLLPWYEQRSPADFPLIRDRLPAHSVELAAILRALPEAAPAGASG